MEANDLTQQVFIKTLEVLRAGRLREPEKLTSFILGTCRMMLLDLRRGDQRKKRLLDQFGANLMAPAPEPGPELDKGQLARCVQGLKERERSVVIMTFYDEQTSADVSGFLGVSQANVRVIRHRAIHQFASLYGSCRMSCLNPIDAAVLTDYWLAALATPEEEDVEEHLFRCDECGTRLREIITLAESLRELAGAGSLVAVVSDEFVKHAKAQGLHVREYASPASGSIECTVSAEDDLLIGHLSADLSGAKRVDLCFCDSQGIERHRLPDIPFRPEAGSVTFQQSIMYAKAAPTETMVARLVAFDEMPAARVCWENIPSITRGHYRARAHGNPQFSVTAGRVVPHPA